MTVMVREASDAAIRFVFAHVGAECARALTATAWHDRPDKLADEIIIVHTAHPQTKIFAMSENDGEPFALVGVLPFGPGLGGMIWAAVETAPLTSLSGYRWWRQVFVPRVMAHYRRIEFTALASDLKSRAWLASVGFTEEGVAYRQGKRGEDFVHCAWINPDHSIGIVDG